MYNGKHTVTYIEKLSLSRQTVISLLYLSLA